MLRVLNCLGNEHDWRLVLLAAAVCFLTCIAAVSLFHRACASQDRTRLAWLLTAGAATGSGIWATHFIAELAYNPEFAIAYGVVLTLVSLVAAIVIVTIGLAAALYGGERWTAAAGGMVVGIGIATMHYLGMAALEMAGTIVWALDLVVASVVLGAAFGAAALDVSSRAHGNRGILAGALLLTLAIVTMHFTAMGAVGIVPDPMQMISPISFSPTSLSLAIAAVAVAVLVMCTLGAWFDRRNKKALDSHNKRLDAAINNMCQGLCLFDAQDRLLVWNERYREMYNIDRKRIWVGCTIRDLLDARIAAGTFSLDPGQYDVDLRAALKEGNSFTLTVELKDGRIIAVVNQPIEDGGWVATHEDITERTRAERELISTRAFLDTIINNVPTPIVVKSVPDLRYLLVNRSAEKFFGLEAGVMVGKTTRDVFAAEVADSIEARDQEMLRDGKETYSGEHSFVTPAGERHVITTTRLPVMDAEGKPQYLINVVYDLTQRKRDEARISYMAHHDPLTDLPNRAAFHECLAAMTDLAGASGENFAVLSLDVDRFKSINDTFGPGVGDELLRQLSYRLAEACEGAFLARTGGDEFSVISPTGPQPKTAESLSARLIAATAADFIINGQSVSAGLTIGISIYPAEATDVSGLLANAEAALHRAKSEARGSVRFFKADMDNQLREKRALQHDLRSALADDELELYYQPQADIDGTVTGFEALVRWHHPRHGMVPPGTFIPLAEESGLIVALGEWILRTACNEAASWPKPLRIAVNLSPIQFQSDDLANQVHTMLLESGLAPGRLEIEITEGVLIRDFSRATSTLRRIKNLGVRIAMDDFGTGYSSLSYLQSFPFDKIKIDQVFVANLLRNPQSAAIVRAVIGLGQGLQLPVIAEGVETKEQLDFLVNAACSGIQGYYIGRPYPIAHYAGLVGRPAEPVPVAAAS